ncbi:nucleotidyltransferase family protein [Chitinophaga sp. HK235]|uniref:nucleotidyltransferase family protein n=1 Tax=Chitinophaga sp. HK235 TaxID=2952571 RepID=UPI001BACD7DE|nr:nucleotidyltransferase family protein [Chitinophaga sp. HK235]
MLNIETLKCTYTNEQVLVILLTRAYFGTQGIEATRDFLDKEVIDWNSFYKLISLNNIRGFIYDIITVSQITINPQIYDTLKKDAMGITLLGSYQAGLLSHLKNNFEKSGITAISYKGHTLAARYYKAPLLRESSDLDLLIPKDKLSQISKYLLENGYESKYNISAHQLRFVLRFHRELSFKSPKDRMGITCSVELQWKLIERYLGPFPRYDFFVQHLQRYTAVDGTSHTGLAPTYDFLCVASHHLIREPLLKFKYLIDLACIVHASSEQLNWEEINLHFKSYNFSPLLWSGMHAFDEIIGLQVPVSNIPKVPYHLFTATEMQTDNKALYKKNFYKKIRLINSMRSFQERIKLTIKTRLLFLIPNLNDLSRTNAPAWTIPLIIPVKIFRFLTGKR